MQFEFTDGSILLRTYRESDAPALYEAVRESVNELTPWLAWCHEDYSIEESREFISARNVISQGDEWYSFAVDLRPNHIFNH